MLVFRRVTSLVALALVLGAASRGATAPLDDDMLSWEAAPEAPAAAAGEPFVLWLWFADGGPKPEDMKSSGSTICAGATPPKFTCWSADTATCMKDVQTYLDKWYADFNIVFTTTKPTTGDYATAVISSEGSWCPAGGAGIAPTGCKMIYPSTSYTFICRKPGECAEIVAQEHGHTVGLAHVTDSRDLMFQLAGSGSKKWIAEALPTMGGGCSGMTQNSYEILKMRLGEWTGGPKYGGGGSGGAGGAGGSDGGAGVDGGKSDGGDAAAGDGSGAGGSGGKSDAGGADAAGGVGGASSRSPGVAGGCALLPIDSSHTSASVAGCLLAAVLIARRRSRRRG